MTSNARKLLAEALALPTAEREELAAEILDSLEAPPGALSVNDPGFATEIQRRIDEVRAGDHGGKPWDEVRAEILAGLRR